MINRIVNFWRSATKDIIEEKKNGTFKQDDYKKFLAEQFYTLKGMLQVATRDEKEILNEGYRVLNREYHFQHEIYNEDLYYEIYKDEECFIDEQIHKSGMDGEDDQWI